MSFARSLLGYRDFWGLEPIRRLIDQAPEFDRAQESADAARTLLIFETSKQRTWLVATPLRVYCVLDDVRKERPRVQWSVSKADAAHVETRPKTDQTGVVDVGKRNHWWLYSTRLFTEKPIEQHISELIA